MGVNVFLDVLCVEIVLELIICFGFKVIIVFVVILILLFEIVVW